MDHTLSPESQEKARKLARLRRKIFVLELGLDTLLLMAFLFTGASIALRTVLPGLFPLNVILFIIITSTAYGLLFSPLSYYQGFTLPHRYGLSHQRLAGWLADQLKGWGLATVLVMAGGIAIYWFLSHYPGVWWLGASFFMIVLSVVLTNLAPILIFPLFFKLEPLTEPSLVQRLKELAQRTNVEVMGIYTANVSTKSTTSNAGLMGLGNTRRVVLSDTLIQQYQPEEIEAVVAHELGHHHHRDIPRLILIQSCLVLGAFFLTHLILKAFALRLGFSGMADIANFPLLLLTAGAFFLVASPFLQTYSRRLETSADRYALHLASQPRASITAITKLTEKNLNEAEPPWWEEWFFYDHPSFSKRRAHAELFLTREGMTAAGSR